MEKSDLLVYLGNQTTKATYHIKCQGCCMWPFWWNHAYWPQENFVILTKIMLRVIYHDKKNSVKSKPKRANFLETKARISCKCFFFCSKGSYNQASTVSLLDVHYYNMTKCINIHYKDTLSIINSQRINFYLTEIPHKFPLRIYF